MGTNKGQTPEPSSQANYEAAVLDFLDKEMAAVQPNKKQDKSGQEVDALVTDLLKQVITESDQPNGGPKTVSDSLEIALSEAPPAQEKENPPISENLISSDKAESSATEAPKDIPRKPAPELPAREPFSPRLPKFALGIAPRRKGPMIAVAFICLLFIIGAAVFYLWGSSENATDTPESQPAASVPLAIKHMNPMNMDAPATLQQPNTAEPYSSSPIQKSEAILQNPPRPARKSPAASPSGVVPATPARNTAVPKPEPAESAASSQSTNPASDIEPELPVVKPLMAQISAPSPLTAVSNLSIDRSDTPPMPDGIALANSALERTPMLTSQTQSPTGSRNLVPSVLISQVSPAYPELAIRSRASGSVVLELQIDSEGKVVKATPVSGPSVFYSEAVKAAMQYRYRPAALDGKNVSSKSRVTMAFNLK